MIFRTGPEGSFQTVDKGVVGSSRQRLCCEKVEKESGKARKVHGIARNGAVFPSLFCQLFQIHACKSKRGFDLHARFPVLLRIPKSVPLLRCGKHPFDRFFSVCVVFSYSEGIPVLIGLLYMLCPYMPCYDLYTILAVCALSQIRAMLAAMRIAFVFPVSFAVWRTFSCALRRGCPTPL